MPELSNIYLVGPMGAGKTTVGRELARRLKRNFIDVDHEIERRTGVRIPTIFEFEGESGFREREANLIEEICGNSGLVVATGGGVVLRPENRQRLHESGIVIYLHAPPHRLYERTRKDPNRPLLQVKDPEARIRELLAERDPLYRETAHLVIESPKGSVGTLVMALYKELKECGI